MCGWPYNVKQHIWLTIWCLQLTHIQLKSIIWCNINASDKVSYASLDIEDAEQVKYKLKTWAKRMGTIHSRNDVYIQFEQQDYLTVFALKLESTIPEKREELHWLSTANCTFNCGIWQHGFKPYKCYDTKSFLNMKSTRFIFLHVISKWVIESTMAKFF